MITKSADINKDGTPITEENEEFILKDLLKEGSILKDDSKATTTDSQPEKKPEDIKPSSQGEDKGNKGVPKSNNIETEENVPFHKHPRFQELTKENRELKEWKEKADQQISELNNKLTTLSTPVKNEVEPIPEWFKASIGDDVNSWKEYQEKNKQERENIKREIITSIRQEEEQKQNAVKEQEKWVSNQLKILRDEGHEFDSNKLIKLMLEYSPVDIKGNYDFHKGISLYEKFYGEENKKKVEKEKANIQEKKNIAEITTKPTKSTISETGLKYSKDLRNKNFLSLANSDD